ncbi:MAG: outer membrane protein assembly factor BamB family protein [Planctomycetota bacterium]|jgi:outer membrane protein assembly factor BamB
MRTGRVSAAVAILLALCAGAGAAPAGETPEGRLAAEILSAAGRKTGLCVDLGCGSGRLSLEIVGRSKMFVHALETDRRRAAAARRTLLASEAYGRRCTVETGDLEALPYPDYCANLVVRGDLFAEGLRGLSFKELFRVLQPGGLAWIGQGAGSGGKKLTAAQLRGWLTAAGIESFEIVEKDGVWARIRRPRPAGMGEWSHGRRGTAGNNRGIADDLVRPPFQTLWINGPLDLTKFGLVTASAGRLVLRHGGITFDGRFKPPKEPDLVQAFDGYNGGLLWEHRLPDLMGDGLVAAGGAVYAATSRRLLAFEAASGRKLWELEAGKAAEGAREFGWYAGEKGALVAGLRREPKAPKKNPPVVVLIGIDPATGKPAWNSTVDGGASGLAMGEGKVFVSTGKGQLVALDAAGGAGRWSVPCRAGGLRFHAGRVYAAGGVFGAADGKLTGRQAPKGIYVGDRALTGTLGRVGGEGSGVFATSLETGRTEKLVEVPRDPYSPKTGIPDGGIYGRCIAHSASTHCYFFHYSGTVVADLERKKLFPTESFRSNCRTGVIVGNGAVYNSASGCRCTLVVRGNVALVPVPEKLYAARVDARPQLEKGPAYTSAAGGTSTAEDPADWPAFRRDAARSSTSPAPLRTPLAQRWKSRLPGRLTPPAAAGGLVLVGSDDGSVHALDAGTGAKRWRRFTGGAIRVTPTCWGGKVYAGSADGWVYCWSAADGKLVWRFRGGPGDRKATIFGRPESLWPVAGGVIVEKGVAYFCAGRCSHDRVFVYALDAASGKVKWCNDRAGRAAEVTGPAGGLSPHGISPSGPLAASESVLIVPQGATFPAGFRKSDGKLLWWNRRGDSTERSNMNIQHLGGFNVSVGGGLVFAGGPSPFSGHRQRYVAIDAATGRIWGQDHPGFFAHAKVGRAPDGKTILPQNYKWGINVIHFGEGAAPVVAGDGVFVFGRADASFLKFKEHLDTQFKKGDDVKKWNRRLSAAALVVAGDSVAAARGKSVTAVRKTDGSDLWKGNTGAEGDVLPDGLAVARGQLLAVTDRGEVICLGTR